MKPTLPQGTRDFLPETVYKRNFIFQIIRSQFELFGFEPLETPAFENLETLMGKYGDEGDKLIFKILNNGLERVEKHQQANEDFQKVLQGKNVKGITERALKYDLTIPFARFVAMNKNQLNMPFKRYQIQPVWRADRPQRGRYREFTQCDADIVGSDSLINEIELLQIYINVFQHLKIPVQICINNRKVLAALALKCGGIHLLTDITLAIDKLDKIGLNQVVEELKRKQLSDDAISTIQQYLSFHQNNTNNFLLLSQIETLFSNIDIATKGIKELRFLFNYFQNIQFDVTLARGLNYYTGTIIEVKPLDIQMGSIGGGGRYNDLTGLFDVPNVPGVGISFGVDRIYDVMEEKNLFPPHIHHSAQVLLINFDNQYLNKNLEILSFLREHHIACELYPDSIKFDKQMKYANKKNVAFVILIGEDELKNNKVSIKNFATGKQQSVSKEDLISILEPIANK
ncbi:MAG TPA: histidine--tRNA ligase [Chitinophagaceae bacterium]|nr:MAG: histidyl-tRNA synthetase [Bacteroidetes bacterium OLB11]HMN32348.1 histidine--tRNA ligase [Chitinophagaceae bacterium]